ncbi:ABC transporter permease subunit [Patescibacteria group bacterium]|nr:ABC transporter permease subunit [Patescibacteria group bacterium]
MIILSTLKPIYVLTKKELMHYFNSPIAYIFIGVFLIINNWLFFSSFFLINQISMRGFFTLMPWIFLFLAPAITMRLWAEEKKSGTIELLLTLPVSYWQVCIAKFLSGVIFLGIALLCTISVPLSLNHLGNLDFGPVIGGYIGSIFLGGAYISLGLFISSLTKNQIIAFIISVLACFLLFIAGADFIIAKSPILIAQILEFIGLGNHFESITRGVIDSKDIIYYLSFIFFFLWLNVKKLELNRH